MKAKRLLFAGVLVLVQGACSTGQGEGEVSSEKLFVRDCWNGPFDLGPTFFGANAFNSEQLAIRVQRGDNNQEVSDGLSVIIRQLQDIRETEIETPVQVGLPVGVTPPGIPIEANPDPPKVNLALYLHDTCYQQNGALYSIGGTITFHSLFSGDINESNGEKRLTDAEFDADFADPRDMLPDRTYEAGSVSRVTGWFRFYFERGQPAQPFP